MVKDKTAAAGRRTAGDVHENSIRHTRRNLKESIPPLRPQSGHMVEKHMVENYL